MTKKSAEAIKELEQLILSERNLIRPGSEEQIDPDHDENRTNIVEEIDPIRLGISDISSGKSFLR